MQNKKRKAETALLKEVHRTLSVLEMRLHPVAPELAELYKSGALAFVHAAGIPDANRSHFMAIDIMDHGASLAHIKRGWLARYLSQSKQRAMGIPGVSALGSFAGEFSGFEAAFSIADNAQRHTAALMARLLLRSSGFTSNISARCGRRRRRARPAGGEARLGQAGSSDEKYAAYLDQKEGYDRAGDLGSGLRTVRGLSRSTSACRCERRCWRLGHTHENQQDRFQNNVQRLSGGTARSGTTSPPTTAGVTLVADSEFGRCLRANRSGGTDQTRGGVMIIMDGAPSRAAARGPGPALRKQR